ncbi:hypothetical protein BDZ97DRAFT_1901515 [Flammula alnicola]|nr:hypothetical protein BDZ97DRAFT_1901515 [Flammula alnicola]
MPSRRSRSRSRSRRSESPERRVELSKGVSPISESDYFQKSDEFRLWLKEERGKYFDGLSGDRARSYFRKFVKAWNRGKLPHPYYDGIEPGSIPATVNTSYKWSFASKKSRADDDALRAAREEVGAATYGHDSLNGNARAGSSGRVQGPAMPSASDLTLAREFATERRDKNGPKERIEDMVGPKPVGREAMLEKKRARREGDRTFREKGDEGLELDESTLMGGGDSFKEQLARREMAKSRYGQKSEEKQNTMREKSTAYREKEKATMDMFQQLAKQRFG